jgi:hypothetical protein
LMALHTTKISACLHTMGTKRNELFEDHHHCLSNN